VFIPLHDANYMRHLPRPYVNYGLLGVTVICFFLTGGLDQYAVEGYAYQYGFIPSIATSSEVFVYQSVPEPATYITYAFLHGDILHLLGNMAFLWVFGDNVEDAFGHFRYLAFYLACAVIAAGAHTLFTPDSPVPLIGASGSVAGVVGAYLVLHPRVKLWILFLGRIPLRLSAMWVLGGWTLLQVINLSVAAEDDEIAWSAHIGGLIAGAILIVIFRRRGVALFDRNEPALIARKPPPPDRVG
jgi:membrane associated rhomboid family serine protease